MSLTRQNLAIAIFVPCVLGLIGGFSAGYSMAQRGQRAELDKQEARWAAHQAMLREYRGISVREEQEEIMAAAKKRHGVAP